MKTLIVGNKAPLFTLNDENEQATALASFIGKKQILIYFYPKAMTPGCIKLKALEIAKAN